VPFPLPYGMKQYRGSRTFYHKKNALCIQVFYDSEGSFFQLGDMALPHTYYQ